MAPTFPKQSDRAGSRTNSPLHREVGMTVSKRDLLKFSTLLGASVLGASVLTAPFAGSAMAAGNKFKLGYSQFWGTNTFLRTQIAGARKAMAEWEKKGVKVELLVTNGGDTDTTKQVGDLEDLYTQNIDGLLIFPGDSVVLADPVKNIYNKNKIPVVVTDIGLNSGDWVTYVVTANEMGGRMAADHMATLVPKGAKVIVFDHGPAVQCIIDRNRGFEQRAKELGLTVLPRKVMKLSLEDGRRTMEDTLTEIPDIAGVFFQNHAPTIGAEATLEAAKRLDVKLVNFDTDPTAYRLVKEGKIAGTIVQNPFEMGYVGMNSMLSALTGGKTEKLVELPPKLMTKNNAAEFVNEPQVLDAKVN
ncbi:substrate-binding domain-containing protein [Bradyrhizobium sp. C-145]|uniref:substrate-binding domain-containing protein n=1 Tax=Bradyrhizobium sp. C-145 TaxID=574727 RepID=UPI00201B8432|nr:substrate-binding domain-containing protein [Bradyrhizobium sp. C-145]UQR61831.1 substrate-binding domain-containing protein [Bradyrhizobium sp. C-145]